MHLQPQVCKIYHAFINLKLQVVIASSIGFKMNQCSLFTFLPLLKEVTPRHHYFIIILIHFYSHKMELYFFSVDTTLFVDYNKYLPVDAHTSP